MIVLRYLIILIVLDSCCWFVLFCGCVGGFGGLEICVLDYAGCFGFAYFDCDRIVGF